LARSYWFDTMMGKSLRKTGTEREGGRTLQGSLLLANPQQGIPSAGASRRAPDTHGHTLGMPMLVWRSSHTNFGPEEKSLCGRQNVICQFEVLQAGVEGPCLYRPKNWIVRQLDDELKPVYGVRFIREKGKATGRKVVWSTETSSSLLR
jgi:hypothetical protein